MHGNERPDARDHKRAEALWQGSSCATTGRGTSQFHSGRISDGSRFYRDLAKISRKTVHAGLGEEPSGSGRVAYARHRRTFLPIVKCSSSITKAASPVHPHRAGWGNGTGRGTGILGVRLARPDRNAVRIPHRSGAFSERMPVGWGAPDV